MNGAAVRHFGMAVSAASFSLHRMRGYTVLELLIAVVIAGILMAIAVPAMRHQLDRVVVEAAHSDVRSVLMYARALALAGRARVVVAIDSSAGSMRVRQLGAEVMSRGVTGAHGVRLAATRDSLVYDAHGMGYGPANLSVIVRKRAVAETIFVSRLGRIR